MLGSKKTNRRKFPKARGRRPDFAELRQTEAKARQEKYSALSNDQKLELLDTKFGKGLGAKKQRAKLMGKNNASA